MSRIKEFDFTQADLREIYEHSEAHLVRSSDQVRLKVLDHMAGVGVEQGIELPWPKFADKFTLRPGEVTILAGINGHGKTTVTNQIAIWAARHHKVGIASFEMLMVPLLAMMVKIAAGNNDVPTRWANDFITWADKRIHFYDYLGPCPPIQVLGSLGAFAANGCELAIVDNLSCCQVGDDFEREKTFIAELGAIAKAKNMHVILVHHVRKPNQGDESQIPSKFDVKGSGSLTDLVDNVVIFWADKKRKRLKHRLDAGLGLSEKDQEYFDKRCDFRFQIEKQRHGNFEGGLSLWQLPCRQLVERPNEGRMHFEIPRLDA